MIRAVWLGSILGALIFVALEDIYHSAYCKGFDSGVVSQMEKEFD